MSGNGCAHCAEIVATYRSDLLKEWRGYDVIAAVGDQPITDLAARWPTHEILACDCRCHDIWKFVRTR